ncbi:hypothetical protein PWT90_09271 [Aphanocladium album]|nr:hypothetical protein PWT90_09271 [Aphanocladium album]
MDPEQGQVTGKHLLNTSIRNISWSGLTVTARDAKIGQAKTILNNVEGIVEAGQFCAVMGPSGCGKTTLLNILARRLISAATVEGNIAVNGIQLTDAAFRDATSFVEDHDAFIGSLTVHETLQFSCKMTGVRNGQEDVRTRLDALLKSFGLAAQADAPVGKVLSKGQKQRLAVAKQVVTGPKILFLDEPTSGLDSVASFHVIRFLRELAKQNNLVVIASIHQPSASTLNLFDTLLLLSAGRPYYFGPVSHVLEHYASIGITIPQRVNPADMLLELVNVDFSPSETVAIDRAEELQSLWQASPLAQRVRESVSAAQCETEQWSIKPARKPRFLRQLSTLMHRSFLKAYRDAMTYRLRLVMYTGLAVLMGTIWLRLDRSQDSIQLLINALIVSCGFMAFMAVTYVPAFIEDYRQYIHEHRNGLYGATRFSLCNFLVGMPHLFLFSIMFSVIFYWLANCQPSAKSFFLWTMWLYLDLLAAEAVVVLAVSIVPDFVAALVLAAFINVLMFATAGTLVPVDKLNAFYKYGFYHWNFQTYVFQGMMATQFHGAMFDCGVGCQCRYTPSPAHKCRVAGETVLNQYGVRMGEQGRNVAIAIAIILGYRVASWAVLKLRR